MTATPYHPATVREWHAEEGWGVLDSPATPGGCWTHFSSLAVPGYKSLQVGEDVWATVEPMPDHGCTHFAPSVLRRADHPDPPDPLVEPPFPDADAPGPVDSTGIDGPYTSELTLRPDQD